MANSEYLRNLIMEKTFLDSRALPNLRVGLHIGDPGEDGENEVEGYERQPIVFKSGGDGLITNRDVLNFDDMPAATVTHFSIWAEEGQYLTGGPLDIGLIIAEGRSVKVREGELTLKFQQ